MAADSLKNEMGSSFVSSGRLLERCMAAPGKAHGGSKECLVVCESIWEALGVVFEGCFGDGNREARLWAVPLQPLRGF